MGYSIGQLVERHGYIALVREVKSQKAENIGDGDINITTFWSC